MGRFRTERLRERTSCWTASMLVIKVLARSLKVLWDSENVAADAKIHPG